MVCVVKLNGQEHRALTLVSSMKLNPQDHQASSLYMEQGWARKDFIEWGLIEGLKDMNWASPKPCMKPPLMSFNNISPDIATCRCPIQVAHLPSGACWLTCKCIPIRLCQVWPGLNAYIMNGYGYGYGYGE